MLSGVIFDMDGVLVDSHPAHKLAWRRFLSELGREVSEAELAFVLDGRKRQDILRHYLGELDGAQLREYGRRKEKHFMALADSVQITSGLLPFLDSLETLQITMAVATSANQSRARRMLTGLALSHRFAAVVTGDDVVIGKPDPAIFQLAAERLETDPANLLVAEDAVSGVQAAKAAGMMCLGIASDDRAPALLAAGADYVVENFVGLDVRVLQQLFQQQKYLSTVEGSFGR